MIAPWGRVRPARQQLPSPPFAPERGGTRAALWASSLGGAAALYAHFSFLYSRPRLPEHAAVMLVVSLPFGRLSLHAGRRHYWGSSICCRALVFLILARQPSRRVASLVSKMRIGVAPGACGRFPFGRRLLSSPRGRGVPSAGLFHALFFPQPLRFAVLARSQWSERTACLCKPRMLHRRCFVP